MKFLLVILAVGIAFFAFLKFRPHTKKTTVATTTPVMDNRSSGEKSAVLRPIALPGGTVTLELAVSKFCSLGDYDAMKMEMQKKPGSRILFTVESFDPKVAPLFVDVLSLSQLEKPLTKTVTLAASAGQYGVYLCLDSRAEGRCATKAVVDINKLFEPEQDKTVAGQDKIIYFQYLLFDGKGMGHVFERWDVTNENKDSLFQYAIQRYPAGTPPEKIKEEVNRAGTMVQTLKSSELTGASPLKVAIPKMDIATCTKGADPGTSAKADAPFIGITGPAPK